MKTLADYREIALSKNGTYILDHIPSSVMISVEGWRCFEGHVFKARYSEIYQNRWCPRCSGKLSKTLEDYKDLAKAKGFEYIKDCIPANNRELIEGWKCAEGHIWSTSYTSINIGSKCKTCTGRHKKSLHDYKTLAKAREGDFIQTLPARTTDIVEGWKCAVGHVWKSSYNWVSNGRWCPECNIYKPATLEDYKGIAEEHKGVYILEYIPATSHTPINGWKCKNGHIFEGRYSMIKHGNWCPYCRFKSEDASRQILESIMGEKFPKKKPTWLNGLELDGYCEHLELAFEYQGLQHYRNVPYFHTYTDLNDQQERDKRKSSLCKVNSVDLLIVPYTYTHRNKKVLERFIKSELVKMGIIVLIDPEDLEDSTNGVS